MNRPWRWAAGLLVGLGSCAFYTPDGGSTAGVLPDAGIAESQKFQSVASAYIDWNYAVHPGWATVDGIHDYDAQLGRWTREAIEGQAQSLDLYQRRLLAIDPRGLDDGSYYDYLVLQGQIGAARLDLLAVRAWESNPNFYRNIISQGLYTLASLAFDTPDRRLALAAERLSQVPDVLAAARDNLVHPPRIFTEIAIDEFSGTHTFLKTGLDQAFASAKDEAVRTRFVEAQRRALGAVEKFIDWMRSELLPASTGSFALGPELFRQKVALEEGIDLPIEELLRRGTELLRSTQEELKKVAGDRPVRQLLRETSREHPKAETLISDTQALLGDLKAWASTVVSVPPEAACKVQETPVFRRSLSFASMETPGPFEQVARDAYYSITPVDPSWSSDRQEQHLSFYNRYALPLISVHEAYPGHYVQFLGLQTCPSKVRKVFGCSSFSEGWAHYCEQLYVERLPQPPLALRVHQLELALVRICRYIAGIELHTQGMTVEQAVELFVTEGYMERGGAEREARRGAADPTYLVYTLGKHEILKLRDEYFRRTGGTLVSFHNELLRTGYPPLPIARRILFSER
ncbi:MAG TPA: DUF885 domain-containing protein [Planctomycetota bacterium]|nr:DUF885 domain-containing protein [Planctomycetota bacterium]